MFSIKKCGKADCNICAPVRLSSSVFEQIHFIPDPVPDSDKEHYLPFSELYGTQTTEKNIVHLYKRSQLVDHMEFHSIQRASMLQIPVKVSSALSVANSG